MNIKKINAAKRHLAIDLIVRSDLFGFNEIGNGVFIGSKYTIISDQKLWDEDDPCKNVDFNTADYWIVFESNNGLNPMPIFCEDDLIDYLPD